MSTASERGSVELLKQRTVGEEELRKLHDRLRSEDIELIHWFPRGVPAIEAIYGAVRVRPEKVGDIVSSLIQHEDLRFNLQLFRTACQSSMR